MQDAEKDRKMINAEDIEEPQLIAGMTLNLLAQQNREQAHKLAQSGSLVLGLDDTENFVNKEKLDGKKRELLSTLFREREVDSL